jgi:hypothetical protein
MFPGLISSRTTTSTFGGVGGAVLAWAVAMYAAVTIKIIDKRARFMEGLL